jgi:16S rRNA U516 pseudouridylate synthase RsuA-like enzyme
MLDTRGYGVTALHRVEVMGLTLDGLRQGQWLPCSSAEMAIISSSLKAEAADQESVDGVGDFSEDA